MARNRLNLLLLLVAAGLAVAVWLGREQKEPGPPLTTLAPEAVTRIAVEHPDAPAIRLEKRGGHWYLTEPVQGEADEIEINALIGLADKETKDKVEGGAAAELGLEPAAYSVTLNDTVIEFGGVEPLQYRRYVRVAGAVSLVDDPPSAALDKDYADLVAKALLPPDAQIERLDLPKLTLARGEDGHWGVQPADPKATADAMQKLADGWNSARAMWNERAEGKIKGQRVRVTLKGGATREFVVVATEPQLKLHRPDLGVTHVLSKALAEDLLKLSQPPQEEPVAEAPAPAAAETPE